jgi:hypothetical protein
MTPQELKEALADLREQIAKEPIQAGPVEGGDSAWWCFLCKTGHQTEGNGDTALYLIGKAALVHILGVDHEAQKVLAESS